MIDETPLSRREQWRFARIRELDDNFDPDRAARRARVALLFELEYRQHLDGAVPFPRALAAALLNVRERSLVICQRPATGGRAYADGLQDPRGYLLDDPQRLLDRAGFDPAAPWTPAHRPYLFGVDERADEALDASAIYGGDE
ncbi:hypothetical protein ACPXB3_14850 [Gordonia sp. DT219]|uniref:hypothetical protein n=1 Tax=Gordonia sp. DT219 TaxID=3416658 RepID=UPI003CF87B07